MALNIPNIIVHVAEMRVELINDMRSISQTNRDQQLRQLAISACDTDNDEHLDALSDSADQAKLISGLTDELAIVALYSVVELTTVTIMKWRFGTNARNHRLSNWQILQTFLKDRLNYELMDTPGYPAINELRLLNNAIKHEGVVSAELDSIPGWTQGDDFSSLEDVYQRLVPHVPLYLRALAEHVIPTLSS